MKFSPSMIKIRAAAWGTMSDIIPDRLLSARFHSVPPGSRWNFFGYCSAKSAPKTPRFPSQIWTHKWMRERLRCPGICWTLGQLLSSYLLGLLAKIKCSICSYQLNLWYWMHSILWDYSNFLAERWHTGACIQPRAGDLGVALFPRSPPPFLKNKDKYTLSGRTHEASVWLPETRMKSFLLWMIRNHCGTTFVRIF